MLNAKQEKFIQNIIKGMSQREAYKDAYKVSYKDEAIDSKACVLFNSDKVQKRYKELLDKLEDEAILSSKKRMIWLSDIVNGDIKEEITLDGESCRREADLNTKIKAVDILNKMTGEYKTILEGKVEVKKKLEDVL